MKGNIAFLIGNFAMKNMFQTIYFDLFMLNHKNVQKPVYFSYNSFPIISSRNFLKLSRLHPNGMCKQTFCIFRYL